MEGTSKSMCSNIDSTIEIMFEQEDTINFASK